MLPSAEPHYAGKIVILVDDDSQSQAEFTAMAFRASPHATVVGSTTAGADGNVSAFALPGGLHTMISGIGIFYLDKRPTQRIGIIPDRTAAPTIEGIRAGRDEVSEEGVANRRSRNYTRSHSEDDREEIRRNVLHGMPPFSPTSFARFVPDWSLVGCSLRKLPQLKIFCRFISP
jgi:C-terminal processing protease CtpA/Prc